MTIANTYHNMTNAFQPFDGNSTLVAIYFHLLLPERSSLHILTTQSHMYSLHQKRTKRQCLAHRPINVALFQQVMPCFQNSAKT